MRLSRVLWASSPIGKVIRVPSRLIPRDAVVRVLSGPSAGMRWVAGSGNHGAWVGIYERKKLHLFADSIRPGMTVYDVGAHVGMYTLVAARAAGPGGRIVAFEPSPRNVPFLTRHVALNRLESVAIMPTAVGDTVGVVRFDDGDAYAGRVSSAGAVTVAATTLDAVLADHPLPDVVKIDVEGAEVDVLRGASRVLTEARPTLFLATHGDAARDACLAILDLAGYATTQTTDDPTEFVALPRG